MGGRSATVKYGALPLLALAGTVVLENGERQSLAQAVDGIRAEFGVSDTMLGALAAAMTFIGVLGAFPFGVLADRTRRTLLLAGAMAVWTLCMGLNALAGGFAFLFLARLGVGVVEANGPAAMSLLSDYYPVRRRARMIGWYQCGGLLGALLGLGLGGVLVDEYGWQAAFWMWIPLGFVVILLLLRTPEPERGAQDRDFHDDVAAADVDTFAPAGVDLVADLPSALQLPAPTRVGTLDYATATTGEVYRELLGIRSMWFAVMAITISQLSLNALGFWGVDFFKQAHGLSAAEAGGWTVLFGAGAAVGIACGGLISDRLLRNGVLSARVYVAAVGCVLSAAFLLPALLVHQLALAGVLFFVGGFFLTLPVAPSEALMADVVVAQLRGRAGTMRSVVRSASALGPLIVGVISDATTLRTALALLTPVYVVGGALMVRAARTYPADLAFAIAESHRTRSDR